MTPTLIELTTRPGVRAVFSTRGGGVSTGGWSGLNLGASTGDDPAAVRQNRRLLCTALGVDPDRATLGHQVHGTSVRSIAAPTRPGRFTGGLAGWPEGDGLATETPGLALVVLGADCLPVLVWSNDRPQVAAAHAGWRGLVDGVLQNTVAALGRPAQLTAAIGPGVGACCYPVDDALRDRFAQRFGAATVAGEAVDLAAAAAVELDRLGVTTIVSVGRCTSCEPDHFYSYRRDGARTGRHGGIIALEPT